MFWILGACVSAARIDVRLRTPLAVAGTFSALVGWVLNQLTVNSRSLPVIVHLPSVVAESFIAVGVVMALPYLTGESVNVSLTRIKGLAVALAAFSYTLYRTHRPTDAMLGLYFGKSEVLSAQSFAYYFCCIAIDRRRGILFYFAFERNTGAVRQILRKHKTSPVRVI